MQHILFGAEQASYKLALLMKPITFQPQPLRRNYVEPLTHSGVLKQEDIIGFTMEYINGKAGVALQKECLANLLPVLDRLKVTYLYVTDGQYFKTLTGEKKAEVHYGYVLPCAIKGFEHMQVVLGVNYQALNFDPKKAGPMAQSMSAVLRHITGDYVAIGDEIIEQEYYPNNLADIKRTLDALHKFPRLEADIEGFGLKFDQSGIGSIGFSYAKGCGISFLIDYEPLPVMDPETKFHGRQVKNPAVRALLREFLENYQGEMVWHYANFDIKIIIYELWMENYLDTVGMMKGLEVMTRRLHCTRIIAYLATNSCAGNELSLKTLAQEYAGNWAKDDIKDIRLIPPAELLRYNLVDCISTRYVFDKYYSIMVEDRQEALYKGLFMDSVWLITQIELTGMPMDPAQIADTKADLLALQKGYMDIILSDPAIERFNVIHQTNKMVAANAKLKVKQHPLSHFAKEVFNPGSPQQLQILLYELMDLPVIARTKTKQPATGAKTIKALMDHVLAKPYKQLMQAIRDYSSVSKILAAFIPAFENGVMKDDGMRWLHGLFKVGPVSGRLSSSDPNMQNLPAGSAYGKAVKKCFKAPKDWLMMGADFNSLEDYISALTTQDPNKLKVYTDGYDGHSLRAFAYYPDELPDIVDTVISINSIGEVYPKCRQDSKAPTFLLTYGGTYHGLMKNLGWSEEKAKRIEANYNSMYAVSKEYIAKRIKQACTDGYVEVAFGLRLRTPVLHASILGGKYTPREAGAEGRTAGNAMGQSYGLLNNRAAVEFMKRVHAAGYQHDVKMIALIHDAIYLLCREDIALVAWVNKNLVECMSWQDLPELYHPTVKIGAALDIFYPTWAESVTLPINASNDDIINVCKAHKEKLAA
jgi:DNA polymerase-1